LNGEKTSETEVLARLAKGSRRRDAPLQARNGQERPRRQAQGEKPQAGHRDRSLEGPKKGKKVPAKRSAKKRKAKKRKS